MELNGDISGRYRGCLLGLAVGDALGTPLEFKPPGSFTPITDMIGGGPFNLKPGQWTDDTSMALCLAESLIECRGFNPKDQMERYVRWWKEGHLSSTGACFDIGNTTRAALSAFLKTGNPLSGPTDPRSAGNGSLMHLAPVPMFYAKDPREAIEKSGQSPRTTHGAPAAVDACRYLGALIVGEEGIPEAWTNRIACRDVILNLAENIFQAAHGKLKIVTASRTKNS
jgi:ADP-ribosyl-[dinitrogen reductase] hydrolase